MKKLYRSNTNKMVAGVCAGVAEYFDVDVSLVRLLWALMILFGGSGLLLYVIGWVIIPERDGTEEPKEISDTLLPKDNKSTTMFGVLLVGLGAILLFDHWLPWRSMMRFWPVVLIIIGALMLVGWRGDRS